MAGIYERAAIKGGIDSAKAEDLGADFWIDLARLPNKSFVSRRCSR
jgi:hypothetical protein